MRPQFALSTSIAFHSTKNFTGYRWFIDNRLVAETEQPRYLWDTRGERTGPHFITVHAVDDAWNRSATQIPVRVERIPDQVVSRKVRPGPLEDVARR